jgi:cobalt-zinc-cadmium efflux system protein
LTFPLKLVLIMTMASFSLQRFVANWAVPACFCGIQHLVQPDAVANIEVNANRRLRIVSSALGLLIVGFFAQWTIGHWSGSLALQADASHLFSDILALVITFSAIWFGKRPADDRATFGHQRLEILAALFNGVSLLGIAGWIIYVSIQRWQMPQDILSGPMLLGALLGLIFNGLNLVALGQGLGSDNRQDLNLRAAFLHTASDFASSIGAMIAGISIHLWHCVWIDTCIGLMVAALTLISAMPLLQESLEVILEYAPKSVDIPAIRDLLATLPEIERVETLRVWSLTRSSVALCLHLQVKAELDQRDRDRILRHLHSHLREKFGIAEVVIQISSSPIRVLPVPHPLFRQSLLEQIAERA